MCSDPTRLARKVISSKRVRKLGIARLDALFDLGSQRHGFLLGQIDDPAARPLMLRPGLDFPIAVVVERRILGMQLKALEPSSPVVPAVVDRRVLPCVTAPGRTLNEPLGRWLAVHRDSGRARLPAMCGIAGIIGSQASAEIAAGHGAASAPSRAGRRRACGVEPGVALSHRRLAIQDLTEAGHQPMVFGSHVLTYNGELYNHEQLRAALPGPWASSGDTEVLLRLLATQGSACLERLVGMFAFALLGCRRTAPAARPRPARHQAAVLPAAAGRHRVRVGTQGAVAARQAARSIGARCAIFCFTATFPRQRPSIAASAKLPAGHTLDLAGRAGAHRALLESIDRRSSSAAPSDTVQQLDALLREVVPEHTLSDVPVGVFLERRHRFGAHRLLPGCAAHLHPGIRGGGALRSAMPRAASPSTCTRSIWK